MIFVFVSANTGGLLGLFMGFSFLSAIEVIYFISLRLWCAMSKKKKITDGPNHQN
jgi:amiloride-sensitive sodium channel